MPQHNDNTSKRTHDDYPHCTIAKVASSCCKHLFYKDLTSRFHESCSAYIQTLQRNNYYYHSGTHTTCRRLFENEYEYENEYDDDKSSNGDNNDHRSNDNGNYSSNGHNSITSSANQQQEILFLNFLDHHDEIDHDDNDETTKISRIKSKTSSSDPWMQHASDILIKIHFQSNYLTKHYINYTKQLEVIPFNHNKMSMEESHSFESNLVSFMTKTTKHIESLRFQNNDNSVNISQTMYHHRNGIIAFLYSQLKSIMNRYSIMQNLRHRHSLRVLDDPFQVHSYFQQQQQQQQQHHYQDDHDHNGTMSMQLEEKQDRQQKEHQFFNSTSKKEEEIIKQFMKKYHLCDGNDVTNDTDNKDDSDDILINILNQPLPSLPLPPPPQLSSSSMTMEGEMKTDMETMYNNNERMNTQESFNGTGSTEKEEMIKQHQQDNIYHSLKTKMQQQQQCSDYLITDIKNQEQQQKQQQNNEEQLKQEAIFLTNKIQNESLDSVQKVETQMIQITSLLNQFTSLITDQQVEIDIIHEKTIQSRDNVEKGNESLVRAKESKKRSRHYFAWIIVGLGLLLLFFNAIIP